MNVFFKNSAAFLGSSKLTETMKLNYLRHNQAALRAELYNNLRDHVLAEESNPAGCVGVPVILPSSFCGSPRDLHGRYQDAMAVVRKHGKPDLFITFTCNPRPSKLPINR